MNPLPLGRLRAFTVGVLLVLVAWGIGFVRMRALPEPAWGMLGAAILPTMAVLFVMLLSELIPPLVRGATTRWLAATVPLVYVLVLRVNLEMFTTSRGSLGLNGSQEAALLIWDPLWLGILWAAQAAVLAGFLALVRFPRASEGEEIPEAPGT